MSRRTRLPWIAGAVAAALALAGCSSGSDDGVTKGGAKGEASGPELSVSGAFMPQPVSDMAAGFLTVRNEGGAADRLTSVSSPLSDEVTIHESKGQTMRKVDGFDVPADGELALKRGGSHIMLDRLKQRPVKGEKVTVELRFEKSDPIRVELPVMEPTYVPPKEKADASHDGGSTGTGSTSGHH
ncbi:copper chaperone PCu(A)C [Streptomyces sp. NPDC047315]|uniref:copper chaperone PCu(A)C n=1 Tax=Streptomyces sp. NPDC047315 TaxID=3155142 RepID=UPI0033D3B9F1